MKYTFAILLLTCGISTVAAQDRVSAPPLRIYNIPVCQNWVNFQDQHRRSLFGCFNYPWNTAVADGMDTQRALHDAVTRIEALEAKIKALEAQLN